MLKWTLISLAGVIGLGGAGGWLAMRSWLEKNATKESVIQQLESEWNCRADMESMSVDLFARPAKIVVHRLALHQRDDETGKPPAQRKPPQGGPGIMLENAELLVNWNQLISGQLHVQSLVLNGVSVREEVTPEGVSLLGEVFEKAPKNANPASTPAAANTKVAAASAPQETAPQSPVEKAPENAKPDKAIAATKPEKKSPAKSSSLELPFGILVDEAAIKNLEANLLNRQAKTRTLINGLNLRLSEMDVDSGNLAEHNQCKVEIGGQLQSTARIKVAGEMKDVTMANFTFAGRGLVHPFDASTGEAQPQAAITLELKKGSTFGGVTTIGEAAAKDKTFASLKQKFGIDVADVVIGGTLQNDISTEVLLEHGKAEFKKDARFEFADYAVTLRAGSWIDGPTDTHELALQLAPSDALSKKIMTGVTEHMGSGIAKLALSIFKDDAGHLAFDFVSTERLSKPKVKLGGQAGAIEQLFKGLGGGMLQQLIK